MKTYSAILVLSAITWWGLWFTPDQQGQRLMNRGDYEAAAGVFQDPFHQGVAWFRAGEFEKAERAFARVADADAEYNRGNCLVMQGKYEEAVERYDRALQLRPDFDDAENNRQIASTRAKLLERTGGDMGDQKLGADEIRFDRNKQPGGQDTDVQGAENMSPSAIQALWLQRIQTSPAEFLRSKFAYQQEVAADGENSEP